MTGRYFQPWKFKKGKRNERPHKYAVRTYFLKWNQHLWVSHWREINTFFSYSEMSISAHTHSCEVKWASLCGYAFSWNQHFSVFEGKSTPLSLCVFVKSTFRSAKSEINIFEFMWSHETNISLFLKWNQHLCGHKLMWNQHFIVC